MRIKFSVLAAVSSMSLAALATPAFAGGCGNGAPNCNVGVNVIAPAPAQFGPMTVHTNHPMGHLRQVNFQRSPNVSITRIHGMASSAGLSDAPSGFTGGCHPTSTQYCRTDVGTPVNVQMNPTPVNAGPVVAAPYIPTAPVYTAPVQPLRTFIGQGYDPSKFAPRQYGDNTFTPGIAHVPTSYVDRSPANAQAALNSGRAVQQPLANGGMTPAYGQTMPLTGGYSAPTQQYVTLPDTMAPSMGMNMGMGGVAYAAPAQRVVTLPDTMVSGMGGYSAPQMGPMMGAPMMSAPVMRAPMMSGRATAPVLTQNGTYASNVGADGTYWEKTSGPTMFGNTMATQVICKRKLPTQVVNPVVNVPYGVPTAVPTCGPAPHRMHQGHNTRYGQQNSRWTR